MQAVIGKNGDVTDLHVISGDELLAPSAVEAVKQWKYKPYLLEGEPVEVETKITVNYVLSQ
jgi:protein TonB